MLILSLVEKHGEIILTQVLPAMFVYTMLKDFYQHYTISFCKPF